MNWMLIGVGIVGLAVALLVARGVYLIGRGTEAEHQARMTSAQSMTVSTGWALLDMLRTGNVPLVGWIEERLGWNQDAKTKTVVKHTRCGSTDVTKRGSTWYCYNCNQATEAVEEFEVEL